MKQDFSASILKKIRAKKVTQRERWYFVVKTISHVFLGVVFLGFGMLSIALVWHLVHNFAFAEFILEQPHVLGKLLWFGVPIFWIILSIVLWIMTEQVVRRTDRAYRIPFWIIGVTVLLFQVVGGFLLEQSQIGGRVDITFERRMDWYNGMERINHRFERMPEEGFLMGKVIKIESNTLILLNDRIEKTWRVHLESLSNRRMEIKEGMIIRLVGEVEGVDEFFADSWRPERPPRMMQKQNISQQKKDRRDMRLPLQ